MNQKNLRHCVSLGYLPHFEIMDHDHDGRACPIQLMGPPSQTAKTQPRWHRQEEKKGLDCIDFLRYNLES